MFNSWTQYRICPEVYGLVTKTLEKWSTYAMLDNCSQGSFIKNEIIEDLEISDWQLKLSLKTLTGEKSKYTEAVDGLIISAVDSKKGRPMECIELPNAYSQNCFLVETGNSKTDKIIRLEYLKPISMGIT